MTATDGATDRTAKIIDPGDTSRAELTERGRAERQVVPRSAHGGWAPGPNRRDPLEILAASNASRVPELVPIRYGRMAQSAFTFFRGAPAIMASDLSTGPTTSIWPQICGDAHLINFGTFGTPERTLVFDLNDFDETLPGPFEWDLKRLAASFVVAARATNRGEEAGIAAAERAIVSYAEQLRTLATQTTLDIWYAKTDIATIEAMAKDDDLK